jgi:hypothetical protein
MAGAGMWRKVSQLHERCATKISHDGFAKQESQNEDITQV